MKRLRNFEFFLVQWYHENKRALPWRNNPVPYHVWVSEIILQQTQMSRGVDYFQRFIYTFPDIQSLANADESDVLKLWQGLGYYSRARNLHLAAKTIVNHYQGKIPEEYDQLIKLKGIGDYTASAILSITFNQKYIVADGNAIRVFSRIFACKEPKSQSSTNTLKKKASQLLNDTQPSDFNQAIMDMGAMICKPDNPLCSACPVQTFCQAFKNSTQHLYPLKAKKTAQRKRYFHYFVVIDDKHRFLIYQRVKNDIWRNLWEFPCIETADEQLPGKDEIIAAFNFLSYTDWELQTLLNKKHILTHQLIFVRFYILKIRKFPSSWKNNYRMTKIKNMNEFPVHNLMKKGLTSLAEHFGDSEYCQ